METNALNLPWREGKGREARGGNRLKQEEKNIRRKNYIKIKISDVFLRVRVRSPRPKV